MSEYGSIRAGMAVKTAAVAVVLSVGFLSWSTINRALGVMVGANANSKEIAEIGTGLAPGSAWAHFASGVMLERTFLPDDLVRSRQEFEKAVSLSPHDYRIWLGLAGSCEKNGDGDAAETAFRKSLELAPNYAQVQWTVGNFLLRRGKSDEAFELIRSAASKDSALASSASSVAWSLYDGDVELIKRYFGDSVNLKAGLAAFLAGQGRFDDAVGVWATIPEEAMNDKLSPLGDALLAKLIEAKRYLLAARYMEMNGGNPPKTGEVTNGGFEDPVAMAKGGVFEWQFADAPDIQIGVDPSQTRDGRKETALALVFGSDGRSFRQLSQTIPVSPGDAAYEFSVKYRSDLSYRSTMRWEILDAADSRILGYTDAIAEKSDWVTLRTRVQAPHTEGITIRLVRAGCDSITCPISGRVWFDDVTLQKLP